MTHSTQNKLLDDVVLQMLWCLLASLIALKGQCHFVQPLSKQLMEITQAKASYVFMHAQCWNISGFRRFQCGRAVFGKRLKTPAVGGERFKTKMQFSDLSGINVDAA